MSEPVNHSRRGFLVRAGLTLAAAPMIVRASSLMKLWLPPQPEIVIPLPGNTLLTPGLIAAEALRSLQRTLNVENAMRLAKFRNVGDRIQIRKPIRFEKP